MVSNAAPVGCLFVCVFLMMLLLMNPRTYTQSHTPTVVQLEGVRGGGGDRTLLKFLVRCNISKRFRIGTGRYDNLQRDERLCNLCNCNRIEDETHFLLHCPSFCSIRDMFFSKLEPKLGYLKDSRQDSNPAPSARRDYT